MGTECGYVVPKRSYIYQTSKEVKRVKDLGVEREKIDSPSNERSTVSEKWLFSGKADNDMSDCLLDILFPTDDHMLCIKTDSPKCAQDLSELKPFDLVLEHDDNLHSQGEKDTPAWKMFSAKSALCHLDIDVNLSSPSTTTRLDPYIKIQGASTVFESHYDSSLSRKKITNSIDTRVWELRQSNMLQQPLLANISKTEEIVECNNSNPIDNAKEDVTSSPVHLNGILKQENRGDTISFEFLSHSQVDILSAKMYRSENAVDWVCNFHSTKKRNNSGIWSIKDRHKSSILVGQMCASCQLFAEATNDGYLNNFMQLEFVLYDVNQDKIKVHSDEKFARHMKVSSNQQGPRKDDNSVYPENFKHVPPNLHFSSGLHFSRPWEQKDLSPSMEVAAIVMQVPIETTYLEWEKGSLFLSKRSPQFGPVLVDNKVKLTCARSININVIAPAGRHGMPQAEGSPSPLIERWKSGGHCDCGGWDIGCPILILENNDKKTDDYSNGYFNHLVKLYVQGSKDRMPALTIAAQAEGEYLVEFHVQLSPVQAFAISVAVLHCVERNTLMLHSNALKLLLKDELRHLLNPATEDVIKEQEEMRFRKPIPAKYILNPPFSPIGRV